MAMISSLLLFDASPTLPLPHKIMIRANSTPSVLSASHDSRKEHSSRLVLKAKAADSNSSNLKTSKKSAVNADATSFKARDLFTDEFCHRIARLDVFKSIAPSVSNNMEDPLAKAAIAAVEHHFNGIIKETGYLCAHYTGMKEGQSGLEDQGSAAAEEEEEECSDVEEGGDDLE